MKPQYKYFAFISYSSSDTSWGKKLQRKLEGYRMPAILCSKYGWERKPINPVFFAPTDIQPGELTEELQDRLRASKNLIVICSPHSAKSEWVGKEIAFFHSIGRAKDIYFFIVDGVPHSDDPDTECFHPIVETLGIPEMLGANINEKIYRWSWLNRERAYVQLITKLLSVEFDSIWQRHRRLLRQKILTWFMGIILVALALLEVWINSQPVGVSVSLKETTIHNENLPPLKDAVVTLELENESKTDTIHSLDSSVIFANIPNEAIGKNAHITVECKDWISVDTTFILDKTILIDIARNPHCYGDVEFRLWSLKQEMGVPDTHVRIAGIEVISDDDGYIRISVPLEKQSVSYEVNSHLQLESDIISMPTTKSRALRVLD